MAERLSVSKLRNMDLNKLSLSELRKAYTAYRDVLRKRVVNLAKGTKAQKAYAKPFQKGGSKELFTLTQIDTLPRKGWSEESKRREMLHRVRELQILEKRPRMSVKGWEKIEMQTLRALKESGYTGITKKNLRQFGNYMEALRSKKAEKIIGSPPQAELYSRWAEKKISMDELLTELEGFGIDLNGVDLFL